MQLQALVYPLFIISAVVHAGDLVDRVIASVNNSVITLKRLETRTAELSQILAKPKNPSTDRVPPMAAIRRRALDDLIDEELILQKAKNYLRKEAAERNAQRSVDEQLSELQNRLGKEEFEALLAKDNQNLDELKATMVADRTHLILVQQARQSWVDEYLLNPVSQAQVDKYLEEHPGSAEEGGAPEAQFIFFRIPPGTEPAGIEAIRSKAEKILSRARIGESFDELVSQYSQHQQSKDRGGILDLVNRTSPYPEFAPLFDLESGQVYPQVIAIEGWFCIARVKSKQSLYNLVRRKIALEQQAKALADMRKEAVIVLDRDLFPATEP